jgi:hypothetical protein
MPDVTALALLLGWGTLVGLDLVSVPQAMIARPLVAGTVAGWIASDTEGGLRGGLVGDAGGDGDRPLLSVHVVDRLRDLLASILLAAGDHDPGSVMGQPLGDCPAYSAR